MKVTGIIVLILVILQQQFLQKYGGSCTASRLQDTGSEPVK